MPQLVKKRRSGWAVLAAGAMVASMLAVGAAPSGAQPGSTATAVTPDHNPGWGASWSACAGAAGAHDEMFSDVGSDDTHAAAINCIAYYGISLGKGDGTYAPGENVSAFQMRLFVQRAADAMGADGEAVLGGVMMSDPVTRLDMAKLMFGLVDDIDDGVRISPADNQIQHQDDNNAWRTVDDFFADVKAQEPIFESQLVGALYELGITRGTRGDGTRVSTPDSQFDPSANVTRAQMASFIARTLDHSNLRAEGLTVQRNNNKDTQVSLRDGDFEPIEDASIDVFSSLYPDDAFGSDGKCVPGGRVRDETPSHKICEIDIGDQRTDDEGNVEFTLSSDAEPIQATCASDATKVLSLESAGGRAERTHWAWTGADGDKVGGDTTLAKLEKVARPVGVAQPDYLRVSGGLPTGDELAKMGETVTFTAQLYNQVGGSPSESNDIAVGPDRSRNAYHLRIEKYYVARNGTSDSDAETTVGSASRALTGATQVRFNEAPGDWDHVQEDGTTVVTDDNLVRPFQIPFDSVVWPDADGQFTINLTHDDPQAAVDSTDVGVRFTLTPFPQDNDLLRRNLVRDIEAEGNYAAATAVANVGDVVSGHVIFSDDPSDPHSVTGSTGVYRIVAGTTSNSVAVKVVDQYGDGMRNIDVSLISDLDNADPASDEVTYREEVDITVSNTENGDDSPPAADGTSTAGVRTPVNPTGVITSLTDAARDAATATGGTAQTVTVALRMVEADDGTVSVYEVPTDDVQGTLKTRRNGEYRFTYSYTGTEAQTETITPQSTQVTRLTVDISGAVTQTTSTATAPNPITAAELGTAVKVYWAKDGVSPKSNTTAGDPAEPVPVLVRDVASRILVVNEPLAESGDNDNPMAYHYDANDTYIIIGPDDTIFGANFEMFERALSATYKKPGMWVSMVEWTNYRRPVPGRDSRTIWTVTLTCSDPSELQVNTAGTAWEMIPPG